MKDLFEKRDSGDTDEFKEKDRLAHIALNMVPGVGGKIYRRITRSFPSVRSFLDAGPGGWRKIRGIGDQIVVQLREILQNKEAEKEYEKANNANISILTLTDPKYPELLKQVHDPPILLNVMGEITNRDRYSLAIVGTRGCTHYGRNQSRRFASMLAYRKITVVSGLARGVDTEAHRGAIESQGRTLAVLGSGLKNIYPKENRELAEKIAAKQGAVVSELPLDTPPDSRNFPQRNRIISGLSMGVLVIEAPSRSGALITTDLALEQNREIFALPGNINSPKSQGTNMLIQQGAKLVLDLEDILEELQGFWHLKNDRETQSRSTENDHKLESDQERQIYGALSSTPVSIDDLCTELEFTSREVAGALTLMEIRGVVEQLPGKQFVRR